MEYKIFETLIKEVESGKSVAMLTLIKKTGKSPSKPGMIMLVTKDKTYSTIGGGVLEYSAVIKARELLKLGKDSLELFESNGDSTPSKDCGKSIEVYIKIFKPDNKLLIVGCGHVGTSVYNIAKTQKFNITLFDDREQFCNRERFPDANILVGDVKKNLEEFNIDDSTYIVLSRHSHDADEEALETVIGRNACYIGMLGSKVKISKIRENLLNKGYKEEELDKIHSPVGINVGSSLPEELAVGILAEIIMIKNQLKVNN